jgi:hypothetical protein
LTAAAAKTASATTSTPSPISREIEFQHRSAWKAGVIGAFNVLAIILAVRLILLVAVIGAIIVVSGVMAAPDPWRLGALAIYTIVVVIPLVWLSGRK